MPTKPGVQCLGRGCSVVVKTGSYCPGCQDQSSSGWDAHRRAQGSSGRGGRKWRRIRERIFKRDAFLCQEHLRKGKNVTVSLHGPGAGICDHIIPIAAGGTDEDENLQTLCQACSDVKTHAESRRGRGGH